MGRGKVFLVVGHRNWGKSRTLKALTNESLDKWVLIGGKWLFIRRMSNDDYPEKFHEFLQSLSPMAHPFVIAAFCPVFGAGTAGALLDALTQKYDVFSFVIRQSYDGRRHIAESEVQALETYGPVEIFERRVEAMERAHGLRAFINSHVQPSHTGVPLDVTSRTVS